MTLEDKNSGSATLQYCLRADIYDNSDASLSVGAKKVNLQIEMTFPKEGNFTINNIQSSEFVASSTSASATRSVGVKVFRDSCATGCEIMVGDTMGCFAEINSVKIGDILSLCMKAVDSDVDFIGIESATVNAADYSSDIVQFSENGSAGTDNFVTTTTVADGEVTLNTLLVPAYYDALNGVASGSLQVSGTVLLSYTESNVRRLGRAIQKINQGQNDTPFYISIPLDNPKKVPEIGKGNNISSASGFYTVAITIIMMVSGGLMIIMDW